MSETVFEAEGRPRPSRPTTLATAGAVLAAVAYTVLFAAGWKFLVGALLFIGILYLVLPYLRVWFDQ